MVEDESKSLDRKYYVYAFLDPRKVGVYKYGEFEFNCEPFYIGKGEGRRCDRHTAEIYWDESRIYNPFKVNKIKKIIKDGYEYLITKIFSNLTHEEAIVQERRIIQLIGRVNIKTGVLTNLSDGGEGQVNYTHSEDSRQKISKALKESYAKNRRTTWNKGKKGWMPPDMIEKMSMAVSKSTKGKKKTLTDEWKERRSIMVSKRFKGKILSEEQRQKMKVSQAIRRDREKLLGIKRKPQKKRLAPPWNKGLTKEVDARIGRQGWKEADKDRMRQLVSKVFKGKKKSKEWIQKIVVSKRKNRLSKEKKLCEKKQQLSMVAMGF